MGAQQSMRQVAAVLVGLSVSTVAFSAVAQADEQQAEQVEKQTGKEEPVISASLVGTVQTASDSRVKDEAALRPEIFVTLPVGALSGELHVHIEGSTTPRTNGVTSFLGESNTNVGTATNGSGHGRLQISELFYEYEGSGYALNFGLIDTTAFLDTSAFANDERTQFMNWSLVHNTTIEFPDYTLGAAFVTDAHGATPGVTIVVGGSSGLGDNASHSYPDLFDVRSTGKGVFAGAELGWALASLGDEGAARIGVWTNTADHTYLNGATGTSTNKGVYGVLEGTALDTGWTLRAGKADGDVSAADWFVGAALQRQLTDKLTSGIGLTHTGVSDKLGAGFSDSTQAEAYVKYDVVDHVALTPSIQWVRNPGFDNTGTVVDEDAWVFGLRVALEM